MHFCFLDDTAPSLAAFCPSWEVALQFSLDFIRYSGTPMVKKLPSQQNFISAAYSQRTPRDRCFDPCWNSHLIFKSIHCSSIITSPPLCCFFSPLIPFREESLCAYVHVGAHARGSQRLASSVFLNHSLLFSKTRSLFHWTWSSGFG